MFHFRGRGGTWVDRGVLGVCEVGVVAASQPYQVLALSFVGSNSMDAQEVDQVLWLNPVCESSVHLPVNLLRIELPSRQKLGAEVFELTGEGGTSSWE